MKYLSLVVLIFVFCNCEKETCSDDILNQDEVEVDCGGSCNPCAIEYTQTGAFGTNVLYGYDTLFLTTENSSMRARIPDGSSLRIELSLISGDGWFYSSEQNWVISQFANNSQTFTALNPGTSDLDLLVINGANVDTILVKYFENGNELTRQKLLIRE